MLYIKVEGDTDVLESDLGSQVWIISDEYSAFDTLLVT